MFMLKKIKEINKMKISQVFMFTAVVMLLFFVACPSRSVTEPDSAEPGIDMVTVTEVLM